jgi:hypothetical protein
MELLSRRITGTKIPSSRWMRCSWYSKGALQQSPAAKAQNCKTQDAPGRNEVTGARLTRLGPLPSLRFRFLNSSIYSETMISYLILSYTILEYIVLYIIRSYIIYYGTLKSILY